MAAGPLRPNPSPPYSSLMAFEILERWKKRFQKSPFFLARPLYPHPPPLIGPAIKRRIFLRLSLYLLCMPDIFNGKGTVPFLLNQLRAT